LPYAGFSAGAAIAADAALIGGWRIDGIPVCDEDTGEDLDEVTIVEGLGLVDLAIDVHAAQWGTLARLIAATEAGLVDGGVAIDEFTVLIVGDGALRVEGRGSVWRVTPHDDGVLVSTLGA
jgi:cyanophycinase-like exopeptidase